MIVKYEAYKLCVVRDAWVPEKWSNRAKGRFGTSRSIALSVSFRNADWSKRK